jgi:hypothetical protein
MTKWILTILILGVGVVLVVVFYAQEQSRNSDLKEEVGTASTTLIQNSLRRNATEDRLAAANLDLAVLVAKFPSAQQSMDVEEALFSAAADAGVSIASINCSEPKGQKVGESTYPAFAVSVSVTGDTEDCLTFVGRLGYWLPSASIDSVSLSEGDMSLKLNIFAGVNE